MYSKPPEATIPTPATTTTAAAPETADGIPTPETPPPHSANDKPILKESADMKGPTRIRPDNAKTFQRTVAPDVPDIFPYRTKPPPAVTA